MSLIADYGLENSSASIILMVLSLPDINDNRNMGKMYIQKIIKYFDFLRDKEIIDFSNFKYGKVSYELQEDLEMLNEYDLINVENNEFSLTEEGENAAEELFRNQDEDEIKQLSFAKYLLNDLTLNELMFFMYMKFPDSIEYSIEFDRLKTRRDKLTISLYKKRRINANTAADWLDISKEEFLSLLK